MSIVRSAAVALSTAAFAGAFLTEAPAQAAVRPAAPRLVSHVTRAMGPSQRIAAGSTAPGQGWMSYGGTGLFIDVDTSSAHFTGNPTYTSSVGGTGGQWALTGTSAIYFPTATGFRIYVRWSDGSALTPATAQGFGWYVNWIGVDNP
ncbi:MAG TPA: hypothetical protein VF069_03940 [Streptosporangiaceae bacterium]